MMNIRYASYSMIDFKLWDACILGAACTLPYALSFYLDTVTNKNWDALILNNYEAVMPLPCKSKLGVSYIYQPFYSQQLGIYSASIVTKELFDLFIAAIPADFKYIDLNLNYCHVTSLQQRCNLVLDLSQSYVDLHSNFSATLKRNIIKASKNNLVIEEINTSTRFIKFAELIMLHEEKDKYSQEIYEVLVKLVATLEERNMASIYLLTHQGEVLSGGLFVRYRNRVINLAPLTSKKGKTLSASHFLHNHIIENHANRDCIFDFEGSEIQGVKKYYQQFGAVEENYAKLMINRLPKILRWIKK